MRKILLTAILLSFMVIPVQAIDMTAPTVPEEFQGLMPAQTESFGQGLWKLIRNAVEKLQPEISGAVRYCGSLLCVCVMVSLLNSFPGGMGQLTEFAGCAGMGVLLLGQTKSMVHLAARTVAELSQYGKMLLPVMTAAQAAQGGINGSAALYAGTAAFDAVLSSLISNVMVPLVYVFLALAVAGCALGEDLLKKLQDLVKWLITWCLKNALYIFTGYMSITGVVTGATDAAKLKAAKLTISGMVPVVGGILSDASEAVLVAAGMAKNAAGIYGLLAIATIWISPFFSIGLQYLLLKMTAAACGLFQSKRLSALVQDFSTGMGFLLGMIGAVCILLLVSTVCLMKEVG